MKMHIKIYFDNKVADVENASNAKEVKVSRRLAKNHLKEILRSDASKAEKLFAKREFKHLDRIADNKLKVFI